MSKCPEIRPLLKWAEQEREPITGGSLAKYSMDSTSMITIEPSLLSYHLWGFLNVNLQDRAWEILENCEPLEIPEEEVSGADSCNGLEVWRRVLIDVAQTTLADRLRLEDVVLSPPVCKDEYAVPAALESWQSAYRAYREAGGSALQGEKEVGAIMRMLPWVLKQKVIMDLDDYFDKPVKLQEWLRRKVKSLSTWSPQGRAAHVVDEGAEDLGRAALSSMGLREDSPDGQVLAVFRRKFPGRAQAASGPPPPPRSKEDVMCPNCLGKGHFASECSKPKVEVSKRLCFCCKKPGHSKAQCPELRRGLKQLDAPGERAPAMPAAEAASDSGFVYCGCIGDAEGFEQVRRRRASNSAMMPRQAHTLGIHLENAFAKLAEAEGHDEDSTWRSAPRRVAVTPPPPTPTATASTRSPSKPARSTPSSSTSSPSSSPTTCTPCLPRTPPSAGAPSSRPSPSSSTSTSASAPTSPNVHAVTLRPIAESLEQNIDINEGMDKDLQEDGKDEDAREAASLTEVPDANDDAAEVTVEVAKKANYEQNGVCNIF